MRPLLLNSSKRSSVALCSRTKGYMKRMSPWLGVAKTNLREALQNLEYRGLVTKYLGAVAS